MLFAFGPNLNVKYIRSLPLVSKVLQHNELVLLYPRTVPGSEVSKPLLSVLVILKSTHYYLGLLLEGGMSVTYRQVLGDGSMGV